MDRRNLIYQDKINSLIPQATEIAYKHMGIDPIKDFEPTSFLWRREWDRIFLLTMDQLAYKKGYRTLAYQDK